MHHGVRLDEKIIGGFKRVGAISSDWTMVGETSQVVEEEDGNEEVQEEEYYS